ncbi:MAG: 16S rRNA (uracil(1498)-N(3))-methyltransferase [Desulfobulbaceae bacterium]|nr:16S rRNA (uracil(1498)-N(3))-methyltransferase [Desulfobulbaceae bacterium]
MLFDKSERQGDTLVVTGRRAEHILNILGLQPGDTLRVGEINGLVGAAVLEQAGGNSVTLRIELREEPPPIPSVELILALPRPIMLQRILKQATVLGVSKIHLIRSRKVEKSFFHSPVLQPEKIKKLLVEGLEQAMDTRLPEVQVYHRFKPFVEDVVPMLDGTGLLAHPGTETSLAEVFDHGAEHQKQKNKKILAVGPEGGWSEYECQCFLDRGFRMFTMGPRILHVDTAVVALLAQLTLLQDD